jgi:serine/threonine protein kinase
MAEQKQRFREIRRLFDGAAVLESPQREAWLEEMAGGDVELRHAVDRLLAASNHATGVFENPQQAAILATPEVLPDRWEGRRLGPYEIQSEIGQGGMGVVYLAQRADGAFEKQVAIKVVRQSLATHDFLARFQRERDILAKLEHPNIARLLDGGTSPSGQAYLVMEYVSGEPLLEYADSRRLPHEHRLDLLRQVADAIDYAHEQGIVHRDLKPSNVLVGAKGQVKLLDFGIAAWQHAEPRGVSTTEAITPTIALSPAYASPEQARGSRTTGASDIYSFAMVAYELLSGVMPFETNAVSLEALLELVAERQPKAPSMALVDSVEPSLFVLAERRRTTPAALVNEMERTVDLPLLRALSKRPEDRPYSAGHLVRELTGQAGGPPVNTAWNRVLTAVRRHDILLWPALLTAGLSLAGQLQLTGIGWAVIGVAGLAAFVHRQGWTREVLTSPLIWLPALLLMTDAAKSALPPVAMFRHVGLIVPLIFCLYFMLNYLRRDTELGETAYHGRPHIEIWRWVLGSFYTVDVLYSIAKNPASPRLSLAPLFVMGLLAQSLLPFEIRRKGIFAEGQLVPWLSIRAFRFYGRQLELQLVRISASTASRTTKVKLPRQDPKVILPLLAKWLPEMPREPGEWYSPTVE